MFIVFMLTDSCDKGERVEEGRSVGPLVSLRSRLSARLLDFRVPHCAEKRVLGRRSKERIISPRNCYVAVKFMTCKNPWQIIREHLKQYDYGHRR